MGMETSDVIVVVTVSVSVVNTADVEVIVLGSAVRVMSTVVDCVVVSVTATAGGAFPVVVRVTVTGRGLLVDVL